MIFSTGAIADEVVEAIRMLHKKGINVAHYTFPKLKPIDEKTIIECTVKYPYIFTVEEHNVIGGLGSAVAEIVSAVEVVQGEYKAVVKRIGIQDEYCSIVGTQKYLRSKVGIDAKSIFEFLTKVICNDNK